MSAHCIRFIRLARHAACLQPRIAAASMHFVGGSVKPMSVIPSQKRWHQVFTGELEDPRDKEVIKPKRAEIEERVTKAVQAFDRLAADKKVTMDSHFTKDLGLDSLDHVEVIMAIEDEFHFEIPDGDAERLMTPRDIVQYVCDKQDIYE